MYHEDKEEFRRHDIDQSWTPVTSSATRNSIGVTIGEVGILVSLETFLSISNTEIIKTLIILAIFTGNARTPIISSFRPINCSPNEDIELFYKQQSDQIKQIAKQKIVVTGGNTNVGIEKDHPMKWIWEIQKKVIFTKHATRMWANLRDYQV